jgi:Ca-activated chloride channel family protein
MGLATAVNRLRESDAKSKVIILLTDGMNNAGQVSPLEAAEIAADFGVKVYTVGVGRRGMASFPVLDAWGRTQYVQRRVEIDEESLMAIAERTGGEYFRATDKDALYAIYEKINQLEKSKVETDNYVKYNEHFAEYLLWALLLMVVEFAVRRLWLSR